MPDPVTIFQTAEGLKRFYDFVKDFKLFHSSPDYPSFDELSPEQQTDILWNTWQQQLGEQPEDTEGWGTPEELYDLYQQVELMGVDDNPFENPFEGDFSLTEEVEYPILTEGQVKVLGDSVNEVYRRVDAGEYDWDQAKEAISKILDYVGVPYDSESLRVEGGISDNDGLISNRYEVTDNPEEAVAGGGGGEYSVEDVLGEVGAPSAGSPSGGDESPLGDEEQWVYIGDGIFRHESGAERYDDNAANNDAYVVGDTYSGPDPTTDPGTVYPGEGGGIWITGTWYPYQDNREGGGFGGDGTEVTGPQVPGSTGNGGSGSGGGDTGSGTGGGGTDTGGTGGTGTGGGAGTGTGTGTGTGSGTGSGSGSGSGSSPVAAILGQPSSIEEIFKPELFRTGRSDISHLLDMARLRRMG